MSVQVNYVNPFSTPEQLVTVMVRPVPTPAGMSECAAVVELLRTPGAIFGPCEDDTAVDAQCRRTTWDELEDRLEILESRGVSVTYIRHLLHLAAHFSQQHGLKRTGTATLTLFAFEDVFAFEFALPVDVPREEAHEWTMAFWGELSYVDLLESDFRFTFVGQPAT